MHPAAYDYVSTFREDHYRRGLDIGGRDVNGTARDHFPLTEWTVLDHRAGAGVHVVADACSWSADVPYFDLVLCTEVLEHESRWPRLLETAWHYLKPGGRLVLTCAGPGRPVHSGVDGDSRLHEGEHYGNIDPGELLMTLRELEFGEITVRWVGDDVHATALKLRENA